MKQPLNARRNPKLNIQKCQGNFLLNTLLTGNSRAVHIGLGTFAAGGTKIPQAAQTKTKTDFTGPREPQEVGSGGGKRGSKDGR